MGTQEIVFTLFLCIIVLMIVVQVIGYVREKLRPKYPADIILTKISTRDDAEYPQPDKYPSGYTVKGIMWDYTVPKVGYPFYVMAGKLSPIFRTSMVKEVLSKSRQHIIFRTSNSSYRIDIQR